MAAPLPPFEPTDRADNPKMRVWAGDNLPLLRALPEASFELIYIDPPFNTGKTQRKVAKRSSRDAGGKVGYHGERYSSTILSDVGYRDSFDDYLGFLAPRLEEAHRLLAGNGSLFVHLDYREVHYVKVLLDRLFGRDCFQNEIIWAYDYGARSKSRWPAKHDNILWYSRHPTEFTFNLEAVDRIPYMAPSLVTPEKAARGKTPTDVWWHTIVPTNGREKTGYPNQKPRGILDRIVKVHSNPGDRLLDFFAGSGSFGAAAAAHGRDCLLIDSNPEAIATMRARFAAQGVPLSD